MQSLKKKSIFLNYLVKKTYKKKQDLRLNVSLKKKIFYFKNAKAISKEGHRAFY
jgi:hypothetical protein